MKHPYTSQWIALVAVLVGQSILAGGPGRHSAAAPTCAACAAEPAPAAVSASPAEQRVVDFRYAMPWWQTAICMPDDPDKSLVGKDGQVLLDFGGGIYRKFNLCLQPGVQGGSKWVNQQTATPRAPIVQTCTDANGVQVLQETFVVVPGAENAAAEPAIERLDGTKRLLGWASPKRACSAVFTGVDVGLNNAPIHLRLAVPAGSKMTVVFGLCEGWHKDPGKRPLVLSVDGAEPKTVDPVKDFGHNQPGLYRLTAEDAGHRGALDISVGTPEGVVDRTPILNALWVFDGAAPDDGTILSRPVKAYATYPSPASMRARRIVVLMTMQNATAAEAVCQPVMRIVSRSPALWSPTMQSGKDGFVLVGGNSSVTASPGIAACEVNPKQNEATICLPPVHLAAGAKEQAAFTIDHNRQTPGPAVDVAKAVALRDEALAYWTGSAAGPQKRPPADLPFDTIQIPDAGIQAMIESCVRNIWQAREIKVSEGAPPAKGRDANAPAAKGKPAFHVGPTVYRGLWVVDGSFLLEAAAILNRGADARAGIEYLLSHQKGDGSFEIIGKYWKENGIVLWAATRHAMLTQDKPWLRSHWPALQRVVKAMQNLRRQASAQADALDYRLLPAGFIDGGLVGEGKPEFSNTEWCLAGLKAAVAAANWLGQTDDASAWQKEYDDFYAAFRKAADRDTLKDAFGNSYVPTMMANAGHHSPPKGQWAFCHAIYPGQVFAIDDPLAQGQMAMLRATKVEGMVFDTGWMKDGLWNYFASFYGHAALWMGHGSEAAQVLYDFANHASPTRVWREEQKPLGKGAEEVGDMPHNWASAEFIRLAVHLLELDRGEELHLLEGMPAEWLGPGMTTKLNHVATPFGPLTMSVQVAKDGNSAALDVKPLAANCKAVIVHLPGGSARPIPPQQGGELTFPLVQPARSNYARVREPAVKPAFMPLPPGAVSPQGWLRDWALSARDGLTGHLDEYSPVFGEAWKGTPIKWNGAKPDGTGWPLEQCAYWLDGALRLGLVLHDEALIQKIRARLDPVVDGVNKAEFGTTFIYWKKGYKPQGFDSWAHSQLGRALVALYQGTGDQRVLDALVKVYADYPADMGPVDFHSVTGLCNLEAMLDTYSYSGDRRIFERAIQGIEQPAVVKDTQAWATGRLAPGHMVITYENIRLPGLVYPWSGDGRQMQASLGAMKWLDENHMLPYGVASGEEFASGIGAFRKTETCNVTAMLLATSWMYRILGDGDWGDRMERAFFNAGAAPIARDFKTMCYYQSPNRLRSDSLPCEQPKCPGPEGVRFHQLGCPTVLCCVGAMNRIIPNYIIHMWMATADNGLAATLYGPSTVSALVGQKVPVKVTTATEYPFGETIRMAVEPEKDVAFPLRLRIPAWCKDPQIAVNGKAVTAAADAKGFVAICRTWAKGDTVELKFPMSPRVLRGFETEFPAANRKYFGFEPDALFQPRRLPYASVMCGPLLFALAIPDENPNTPVKDAKWQFALDAAAASGAGGISVQRKAMPARWDWPLDAPIVLTAPAREFDWKPTDAQALPEKPVADGTAGTIQLVPYGCTKFRISMFPVTATP